MACKRSPVRSRYSPPEQGITHCVVSFLFVRNFCLSQTSEALAQPEERRAWTARVHRDLKRPGILHQKEKHRTAMCGAFLFVRNFCLSQTSEALAQPEERRAWTARVHRDLKRPGILHQKNAVLRRKYGAFLFLLKPVFGGCIASPAPFSGFCRRFLYNPQLLTLHRFKKRMFAARLFSRLLHHPLQYTA